MTLLTKILRANRTKHRFSITHLSYLLDCSRPQYERMERGDNQFKPQQLVTLATIYNENPNLYIDLQDVSLLLEKAGADVDSERPKRLLIAALQYITMANNAVDAVVTSITDDLKFGNTFNQNRGVVLNELIETQKQVLCRIESEIKSIAAIITENELPSEQEITTLSCRLNTLTDKSTSLSRLVYKLIKLL